MAHTVDVVVEHDYKATDDQELTIKRGEIIRGVEQKVGGWWKGELRGRVGLFPDSFVRVFSSHDANDVVLRNPPRFCRAMFSYQQANPDELNLSVGDVIQVIGEVEEGWWSGQIGNQRGVFPSNFVAPLDNPTAPPTLPPKPVREQCKVVYPYTAANSDELTLVEGDIITIISRDVPDQGWWKGELRGRIGLFPDNFVTVLPTSVAAAETTSKKPSRPSKSVSSLNQSKIQPTSSNRKEPSTKSGINSSQDSTPPKKSVETNDNNIVETPKSKKAETTDENNDIKTTTETKTRRSLEVDGANKPPVPVKKAGSPVAAMFSGLRQKVGLDKLVSGGHQQNDATDGSVGSKPSGEPILTSISPSPSPVPLSTSPAPMATDHSLPDNFDQIERNSMLNDPRASRVKAPRRRLPSQVIKDDVQLTNGSLSHNSSTESTTEPERKAKTREWEKHKAPWMEELKLNQAKKTSPIAEIGRSKTISTTDSTLNDKSDISHTRLSGSSDKILESSENEPDKDVSLNPIEMSQSMTTISSKSIKVEKCEEVQNEMENTIDMSKSMSSLSSRISHLETNNKISPNELRTSISSSANVVLRNTTYTPSSSNLNSTTVIPHLRSTLASEISKESSHTKPINSVPDDQNVSTYTSNGVSEGDYTPEQLLISKLNERIANLEKVVEAQEAKFTAALAALNNRLAREIEIRSELQTELQKLERCVTRV